MLVLTRKEDEQIVIYDESGVIAKVKINKIDRNQVRIGVEAESHIKIDRDEIFDAKFND